MTAVPVHVVAAVDQHRAALRDLVRLAREHQRRGCEMPGVCAGNEVVRIIEGLPADRAVTLAFSAVAELALLGYGEDLDGLAGLDEGRADDQPGLDEGRADDQPGLDESRADDQPR